MANVINASTITQRWGRNDLRRRFDAAYDAQVIGAGFFESDDYYRWDKERYWKSLTSLLSLKLPDSPRLIEVGGGQIALLCRILFGWDCTVGDVSAEFAEPLRRAGIPHMQYDLMEDHSGRIDVPFDIVVLLEVVEHVPLPAHVVIERIKSLMAPGGVLFLTTPNVFRLRNLIRMLTGREFLDRFTIPGAGQCLGHQIEYSADHLRWQLERSRLQVLTVRHSNLGRRGHSAKARLARLLLAPLSLRPLWRDGLIAVARLE